MTRRQTTWGVALGILACVAVLFYTWNKAKEPRRVHISGSKGPASDSPQITNPVSARLQLFPGEQIASRVQNTLRNVQEVERAKDEWRAPIEFYGRVVDENDAGVPNARAFFVWTDLSKEGHSTQATTSDAAGLFSLTGVRGKHLSVTVECDRYYPSKSNITGFTYSGEDVNFVPKVREPVIFRLQKKGNAEALVVAKRKSFAIPRDGTPVDIDLIKRKPVPLGSGHLRVECWTYAEGAEQRYNWKCKISIPGGGLIRSEKEFDFIAPADPYAPYDVIDMPAALDTRWQSDVERRYFFKLPNSTYGRLTFAMIVGGDHFCIIEGFINPSGSRNLEYDPAAQPKPRSE